MLECDFFELHSVQKHPLKISFLLGEDVMEKVRQADLDIEILVQ